MILKGIETNIAELKEFLLKHKLIEYLSEISSIDAQKQGNMNACLQVYTNKGNFFLKQSFPFVAKYPQIVAPLNRVNTEFHFYDIISKNVPLASTMPQLLAFDVQENILVLAYLEVQKDLNNIYLQGSQNLVEVEPLVQYLSLLHHTPFAQFKGNNELLALNHFHIFVFPFQANEGFDLDTIQTGLGNLAKAIWQNEALKHEIHHLGKLYLNPKKQQLIHGDFHFGSVILTSQGIKVIDPEFANIGQPEFDLGVLIAHFEMAGYNKKVEIKANYKSEKPIDWELCDKFAAVEILRRLLGVAQINTSLSFNEKQSIIQKSIQTILQ